MIEITFTCDIDPADLDKAIDKADAQGKELDEVIRELVQRYADGPEPTPELVPA